MTKMQGKRKILMIAVAGAAFLTSAWQTSAAIPATVTATKEQIVQFLGTYGNGNLKLVFTGGKQGVNRKLYTLDYTSVATGAPPIVEMTNTTDGILASISPDGQWIVYASGPRYDSDDLPSTTKLIQFGAASVPVTVKDSTAYEPRFVPNVDQMTVIYTTTDGANVFDGQGQTLKMACPGGTPSGLEEVVYAGGSWIGGLNWDHTFLCTGYQEARMIGVGTNAGAPSQRLQVVTFSRDGVDSTVAIQVCNPSPSPSRVFTNTMMYLDFGYPFFDLNFVAPGIDMGPDGYYATHELFFIGKYDNTIVRDYRSPNVADLPDPTTISGRAIFDDPEWSNHPYFAVTSVQIKRKKPIRTDNREAVYLINLKDSTYLKILEQASTATDSANFQWPWVWVDVPDGFTEDTEWLPIKSGFDGVRYSSREVNLALTDNILNSNAPLRKVSLFNLLGSQLQSYPVAGRASSVHLKAVPAGTYFVQIETMAGKRATMRWTVRQ